jgi:hypothetical protein
VQYFFYPVGDISVRGAIFVVFFFSFYNHVLCKKHWHFHMLGIGQVCNASLLLRIIK